METSFRTVVRRHVAYKLWIKDIHTTQSIVDQQTGLIVYMADGKTVIRVNIIGGVIEQFSSGSYGTLVIDDGSGQVRLKVWGDDLYFLDQKEVGDFVLVVGRIAEFENERYIRPEIVRKVSFDWALHRRLELTKMFGAPVRDQRIVIREERRVVPEVEPSLMAREVILNAIEKVDEVNEEQLIRACGMEKEKVLAALQDLVREGEVYAPRPGFYRLI